MDAKPQKPLRPLRVYGDENNVIKPSTNKTLHSRNKSSPSLSSLAAVGANKPGLKRTAFGDLSNTFKGNSRFFKDDLSIPAKGIGASIKENVALAFPSKDSDKSGTAFLRPAQRPLKDTSNIAKGPLVSKAEGTGSEDAQPQTVTTKELPKKKSSLFKVQSFPESSLATISESAAFRSNAIEIKSQQIESSNPPSEMPLPSKQTHAQPDEGGVAHQVSEASKPLVSAIPEERTTMEALVPPLKVEATQAAVTNVIIPCLKVDESESLIDAIRKTSLSATNSYSPVPEQVDEASNVVASLEKAILPTNETEEYWEDEEADNCEDEGFVTARSIRSRGDNVTGNVTATLVPRHSMKADSEIAAAKEFVESMMTIEDYEDEAVDTSMVAEYGDEIFEYMRELEAKMQPNPYYMDYQTEIQWSMRSILMDWIVQVHLRFNLLPETLFLCVNYIDRFLSAKIVSLNKLQLVGAAALFIAAKYEEINCPSVQEIVYMVDNGYTVDEVLKAERFMLSMLQFELGWPGPMSFLRRISKADDYDLETRTLAKYLLEVTIMDERFLQCPPSFIAAGAHCLARQMLKKGNWSPAHIYYSNYTYPQLRPIMQCIFECCIEAEKHHSAIFDKYQDKRYKYASRYVKQEIQKGFQIHDERVEYSTPVLSYFDNVPWVRDYMAVPWH